MSINPYGALAVMMCHLPSFTGTIAVFFTVEGGVFEYASQQ